MRRRIRANKVAGQSIPEYIYSTGQLIMNSVMSWLSTVMLMLFIAGIWFMYLVRIVLNDEVVNERRRRRMRARELERRRIEDKIKKRRGLY